MLERVLCLPEVTMTLKLFLSLLCGGLLGFEREQKRRPAGLRTYILVCVGATLVMITNEYLGTIYAGLDPTRMGAQVISGIGFLGVGTIIVTGDNRVKGLTTAAGLWSTACVGLAIGAGNYYAGILVTAMIYIVMRFLQILDQKVIIKAKILNLYIEFEDISCVGKFIRELRSEQVKVYDIEIKKSNRAIEVCTTVLMTVSFPGKTQHAEIMEHLNAKPGVIYAEEL